MWMGLPSSILSAVWQILFVNMIRFTPLRTPVNKDFWQLMAKIKDFPSGKKKSIDACSDANGHNGTNLLIELALRLTQW